VYITIKRSLLAALVLAAGLVTVQAGEKEMKECSTPGVGTQACNKLLKGIVHLNDNDIRFARKGGGVVFVDPTTGPDAAKAVAPWHLKPDLILITHPHSDHFQPAILQEYIRDNPAVVLAGPAEVVELAKAKGITGMLVVVPNQSYALAGFEISTLPAYFVDSKEWGHPKAGQWVGYVLSLNGARYYVTGDTQPMAESATAKADVIFPLLYGCGGNMEQALEMVKLSGAKLVVPVHTGGKVEIIKKYIASLPQGVQSAYYLEGKPNQTL
jgi:L-ascorbate metabolism protein UlaG (beta-lactamase superfamily)